MQRRTTRTRAVPDPRIGFYAACLCTAAMCAPSSALAKILHTYDVDSLVAMCSCVVEGTIEGRAKDDGFGIVTFRLDVVYKGGLQNGTAVRVVGLSTYRKPQGPPHSNTTELEIGDHLILFLQKSKPGGPWGDVPDDPVLYHPVVSGVMFVSGDTVRGFSQIDNPGPAVLWPATHSDELHTYEAEVRSSVKRVPGLLERLGSAKTARDVPWLMEFLRGRADVRRNRIWSRDYLSEVAFINIANMHDPRQIATALPLAADSQQVCILAMGLGTPSGRDFLLTRVADPDVPVEQRVDYTRMLKSAGAAYHVNYVVVSAGSARLEGATRDGNAGYVTRIARVARSNAGNQELCNAVVGAVGYFASVIVQSEDRHLHTDLAGAVAVLATMHRETGSAETRYAIETTIRRADARAHEALGTARDRVISIVRRARLDRDAGTGERLLVFDYGVDSNLEGKDEVTPQLVLLHIASNKMQTVPLRYPRVIRGKAGSGGSNAVVLPDTLPAGRYRVFLRVTVDGLALDGHSCEIDLQ